MNCATSGARSLLMPPSRLAHPAPERRHLLLPMSRFVRPMREVAAVLRAATDRCADALPRMLPWVACAEAKHPNVALMHDKVTWYGHLDVT